MRKAFLVALIILFPLALVGCVSMALPRVNDRVTGETARPVLNADGELTRAVWESEQAPALRQAFQDEVYGPVLLGEMAEIESHDIMQEGAFGGRAIVEQFQLRLEVNEAEWQTPLVTVRPMNAEGPVPVIVLQTFCGNLAALRGMDGVMAPNAASGAPDCMGGPAWQRAIMTSIFGEYIAEPPFEMILDRGYAVALIYPGDLVPDNRTSAMAPLAAYSPQDRSGAIATWAYAYSKAIDVLETRPEYDSERMAVWGHSRNGKSALLAGAFDPRIDLVISHQSGTGGTTLTRSYNGESVAQITDGYPHWFNEAYAGYSDREAEIPVDQHQLIALLAPRPLLIGGAWRDRWSDPMGSYQAARGANPVYALYGSQGLRQSGLGDFDPSGDIAITMRNGLHGVNGNDWTGFLAFLDAHFMDER